MNKKIIKKIYALIASSILLCGSSMSFAVETEPTSQNNSTQNESTQGSVQFIAEYDTNITPQQGDVFVITYGIGNNTAQMEIDASLISSSSKEILMPNATYSIFNIEAKSGSRNENIAYAVNNQFIVSSENKSEIRIFVGENSVANIISLSGSDNLIVKNYTITPPTPSVAPSYDAPSLVMMPSEIIQEPSTTIVETPSMIVDTPSEEMASNIVEPSNNENKPSEKTEEEIAAEKEAHRKSLINRGIIFLLLAGGSFAGLIIGHKMGKF